MLAFEAAFGQRGQLRHEIETQLAHDQSGSPWWKEWLNLIPSLCPSSACQSHQGSRALPSSSTAPASGTAEVWPRGCPPGSALLGVSAVAGAGMQETLSKRTWAWQVVFHGAVVNRHFCCMTFFWSEVWHSLLFKLQYCIYTGNKSLICAYCRFTVCTWTKLTLAHQLSCGYSFCEHQDRCSLPGWPGRTPLRQTPWSAALIPLFLRVNSLPRGTITDSSLLWFYIFSGIGRIWLPQPHYW